MLTKKARFELAREDPNGLVNHRLNHSATSPVNNSQHIICIYSNDEKNKVEKFDKRID